MSRNDSYLGRLKPTLEGLTASLRSKGIHESHLSFGGEGKPPTRKPTVPTDARSEFLANRGIFEVFSGLHKQNWLEIEGKRAFRKETVGRLSALFGCLKRTWDRTALRRTALRCRFAPPVGSFWLEWHAGF
jgi:hypothetical protein